MKILALDQSSHVTGWAVFEEQKLIEFGKLDLEDADIGDRLYKLRTFVSGLINKYEINILVIEDIQLQANVANNVATFKTLAEVFGVLVELATELKLPCKAILAGTWKSALGIKGRARAEQKRNAQAWVQEHLGVKAIQDICDAICIGVCYTTRSAKATAANLNWE